jgi:hypothetical protein
MEDIIFIDGKINSDLSQIRQPFKAILGLIIAASLIWGSLGKVFVYKSCIALKIIKRPINVLMLIDEIIHHSLITFRYKLCFISQSN